MKNISFLFLVILLVTACKEVPKETNLSGLITNKAGEKIVISGFDFEQETDVKEDGSFSIELNEFSEGYYTFSHGRESSSLYIIPGESLELTLDTKEFDETIKYTGKSADASNYLAQKYLVEEKNQPDFKALFSSDEETYLEKILNTKTKALEFLSTHNNLPKSFVELEKKNIEFGYLTSKLQYESGHRYYSENEEFVPSDQFLAELEKVDLEDEDLFIKLPTYKNFVLAKLATFDLDKDVAQLANMKSDVIKSSLIERLMYSFSPTLENLDGIYNSMRNATSNEKLIENLDTKYTMYQNLIAGKPSPGFKYTSITGEEVDLADLKGKNVYIDVWATWCGPCKAEIPHLKEIEKEFRNKNIEFVSISVDEQKDVDKWKKMIEEKELHGIQLITEDGWNTDFVSNYDIQGIPRFILVDTEGKIVSADAPRPSSDTEIKDLLNGLRIL